MKKILIFLVVPFFMAAQNPGFSNLQFDPNPPTEGGSGKATVSFGVTNGDLPATPPLEITATVGNLAFTATLPSGGIADKFDWSFVGANIRGVQNALISDFEFGVIEFDYTVTGSENDLAVININLAGVPDNGNIVDGDQVNEIVAIDALLPVKLTKFNFNDMNCDEATLAWTTASETNNEGFVVERSFGNLSNFAEVGFVKGAGNSTELVSYEFTDTYPIDETEAYVYYRLKQVDLDGQSEFSDVIKGKRECDFHIDGFTVTPNPATTETIIKSDLDTEETRTATILNNNGKVVEKVTITSSAQRLNLSSYLPGVYSVRIEMDGEVITKRFIKVQ